ncbi:hypothetical protein ACWFMI_08035 [Nocardiopsis terrae]
MNRVPLPSGFNDFARELESHRRSLSPRPPAKDRYPTLVRLCVAVLGVLVGVGAFHATEGLVHRVAFALDGVVVEAEVTAVDHGEPVVRFPAADGAGVTTVARGEHTPGDPLTRTVVHLPDAPEQAVLADHRWSAWPWALPVGLLLLALLLLRHRGGVRAGWFRRRVRVLRWGTPTAGSPWRRSLPWTAAAGVLVAAGTGLYALPLLRSGRADLVADGAPLWLCGFGAALVVYGLGLGVQALYRHAEHAPLRRPPRVFRPVPHWVPYLAAVLGGLVPAVSVLLLALTPAVVPDGTREHGTAEVVDYRCAPQGRSCTYRLTVEYEADGLLYRSTFPLGKSETAEELIRAAEAPVSWDPADPSDVRWEK